MAKLYYYAHNLDLPNALENSDLYFENALHVNPMSSKARIGLAGNYTQRWSPADKDSYKYLDKGFSLLHTLYRDGIDSLNPALYSSMFYYGLLFHSKAICFDSWTKLKKYCPKRAEGSEEERMISSFSDSSISIESSNSLILYQNKQAGFRVAYPDNFILFREDSKGTSNGMYVLMLETPLTQHGHYEPIRNSLSIMAIPCSQTTEDELVYNFLKRGRLIQDSVCNTMKGKLFYYSSHENIPDEYRGIITIIKHSDFYYQFVYSATYLTFEKNMNYFVAFCNSLSFK
jgi:hypothetical protein